MSRPLKTGLIIVGALVVLFVTAAAILVATVDPNEYKADISKAVKDATGRELVFEGDIKLNVFPWLGLEVGPVALGNAPGFAPKEMVRVSKAMASIRIMPLLSGEIAIGDVVLDGFALNLAVNKQGVSNWADLAGGKKDDAKQPEPTKPEAANEGKSASSGSVPQNLSVQGVSITGAQVNYVNEQAGQNASVSDLNLTIGQVGDKLTTPFELTFAVKMDQPKIDARPKLSGMATFNQSKETFDLTELALELFNMRITGFLYAKDLNHDLNYSGEFKLAAMNPRDLMDKLGIAAPVTSDPKALTSAQADLKINGTADSVSLEALTAKLDDTTLTANGAVNNFAKPAITAEANVDDLNADRYLPPASDKKATSAAATSKTESAPAKSDTPATEPDLSALKDLNLSAKLTVGKLKAMNLTITDILVQLRALNGVVTIQPFSASLYQGALAAKSVLDARSTPASWMEGADLKNVQAGPLLKDLTGKDHILGTTVAKYSLTGSGLTPDNIKKSISGTASFAFTDGAINGINVAKMLRDAWAVLKGQPSSSDEAEKTDFAELLGSAVLTKGHITNNDLLMKSPLLRLTGKGWADLPQNNLDYLATVTVVGTLKGQDGASIEDLKGLPLPVRAKGSLDNPSISLDTKALAEALFKGTFKKGTKDLEKNLKNSILGGSSSGTDTKDKKSPGSILKNLFK
ncbi:AsmA family protein [Pseudodesulfovibrio sp.]|uniref:AsmA family protein n=1 Tax=unclassified Pseudodesulfovibrio TaxID=2661612 RepID=UPI003B00AC80